MTEEVWAPVPDWPGYYVSNFGQIKGHRGIRKPLINADGYPEIKFTGSGLEKKYRIHRLVCIVFNGPPPFEGAQALHKDSNKANCRWDNLYWGTIIQNMEDRRLAGNNTGPKGEDNPNSVLTWDKVREIRRRAAAGESGRSLAREFGVVQSTASAVIRGTIWKECINHV